MKKTHLYTILCMLALFLPGAIVRAEGPVSFQSVPEVTEAPGFFITFGDPEPDATATPVKSSDLPRLRVTENCSVFQDPDSTRPPLGNAVAGEVMVHTGILETDGFGTPWYQVFFGPELGWIPASCAQSEEAAPLDDLPDPDSGESEDNDDDDEAYTDFQTVKAVSGNTHVRSGPGKGYESLGAIKQGSSLPFTGKVEYDSRPVAWYSVNYNGVEAWVSSMYTELD